MARLLTILTLILAILLFPPATLALISNNAVPGDSTYPIKRGLEAVILKVASIHPISYAWFSIERSNRRFEEATTLLTRGTKATETLDELVVQTESIVREIAQIKDPVRKQELTEKLHKEIQKYDEGLEKVKEEITQISEEVQPSPTPRSPVVTSPVPTMTPSPQTPKPSPTSPSKLQPPPQPTPPVVPSPPPSVTIPSPTPQTDTEDIDRTRDRLREIREGLSAAVQDQDREDRENRGRREDQKDEDKPDRHNRQKSDEKQSNQDNRENDSGNRGRGSSKKDRD